MPGQQNLTMRGEGNEDDEGHERSLLCARTGEPSALPRRLLSGRHWIIAFAGALPRDLVGLEGLDHSGRQKASVRRTFKLWETTLAFIAVSATAQSAKAPFRRVPTGFSSTATFSKNTRTRQIPSSAS